MTMKQVKQRSGTAYDFNLDPYSLHDLHEIGEIHKMKGCPCSNSVIVRRALRLYGRHMGKVLKTDAYEFEQLEIGKATNGIP